MSDEKNLFDEENENNNEEILEEAAEKEEAAAEEPAAESDEGAVEEAAAESADDDYEDEKNEVEVVIDGKVEVVDEVPPKKQISKTAACAISVVITLAVVFIALLIFYFTGYNRYNTNPDGYSDTIETYASMSDKTVAEVMEELSLPSDMKPDTILDVAQFYIPVKKMAENYGMDVDSLKKALQLNEEDTALITEETRWGEVTRLMRQEQEAAKKEAEDKSDSQASEAASEEASESADSASSEAASETAAE